MSGEDDDGLDEDDELDEEDDELDEKDDELELDEDDDDDDDEEEELLFTLKMLFKKPPRSTSVKVPPFSINRFNSFFNSFSLCMLSKPLSLSYDDVDDNMISNVSQSDWVTLTL